jgi:hypothetical protein
MQDQNVGMEAKPPDSSALRQLLGEGGGPQARKRVCAALKRSSVLQGTEKISGDVGEPWATRQRHGQIELLTQHLENVLDPGFTGQPVHRVSGVLPTLPARHKPSL